MLGILGGMGPLATVDLMHKIIALTPAAADQQHIPLIVYSDGRIPDLRAAILDPLQPSPLPKMIEGIKLLEQAGAQCIVIACNTAHHWSSSLAATASVPIIDIAQAVCISLRRQCQQASRVGILATYATLVSGFYQRAIQGAGFSYIQLSKNETYDYIERSIALVKQGEINASQTFLRAHPGSLDS